jgi:hypothetical protein
VLWMCRQDKLGTAAGCMRNFAENDTEKLTSNLFHEYLREYLRDSERCIQLRC